MGDTVTSNTILRQVINVTKTNWQDPGSTEVRSAHISGLQEAVGKIEESIGINTLTESNIPLLEVYISNEDRCRIYQAPEGKRNWLSSPSPIIKKNGVTITDDFEIDYGGGAVIFTTPISEADVLTSDIAYTAKIIGKQLSSEDYSSLEKEKLAGIQVGANKYTHPESHPARMILLNDASNVEDSIAGIKENIASHQSETATNVHRASNISITDAEGRFTATNVESALNELFTSANDGKTAVATAITAKGVDASPTDTFPILATKIGQITTGKRVITTTLTVASTQKNFYIQNVSIAQASWYVIYNGSIPFEPSRIVLSNRGTLSPTADPNYPLWVVYDKNGVTDAAGPDYIKILTVYLSSNGFGTWASSGQVFRLEGEAYVNGLGFCLPLRASSSTPSFAGKIMDCTIYE